MSTNKLAAVLTGLAVLAVLSIAAIKPYFEARSFNRCTGGNASYFDALFTQLRVEECKR